MWLRLVRRKVSESARARARVFFFPLYAIFPHPLSVAGWQFAAREPPRMNFLRLPARPPSRRYQNEPNERERERGGGGRDANAIDVVCEAVDPREEERLKFSRARLCRAPARARISQISGEGRIYRYPIARRHIGAVQFARRR